ncbi:MAG: 3-phosphoshikimate 1-carboxyvinyltransferase [Kineothrix sp.]|jgi:3-phosphoshikimate 1-carboxyvinyltransferase|nr:3-phosphoshikimate 1-carboxyvinyltransferase [Lachnospiraceae bacterium 28-4]MCI8846977.1 3-phosphoshikimate 1-carboxyvinyltransferase [Lachnospiraceae bacterium]MCX4344373.1 3-phosphoshikimate 1-carboxyvinyltransferase [Kineothrix sp.]
MKFHNIKGLKGEVTVPGDKSISHRAVMFGALSEGKTEITNFLQGADCLSTIGCFRRLGIDIENQENTVTIWGKGLDGLSAPSGTLDAGNSGTTTRLISGILAAQPFTTTLTGDSSIQKRPMKRIIEPLSMMGARIESLNGNGCAPLQINGSPLHGIHYHSEVASAQVKSAILLAGLYAEGETAVTEPVLSRNHSELMLRTFGANIRSEGTTAVISPRPRLTGQKIRVPGDISSAAYFIAAGLLVPGSDILIRNVGINPTRAGILKAAKAMGGHVSLLNENREGEPTADLHVVYRPLHGTVIEGDMIPTLIDELPIIAVMAAAASGTTIIRNAAELKVKESNRIDVMVRNLSAMGCSITGTEDGMIIEGKGSSELPLTGAVIDSFADHRIAMSFAVASLIAEGETTIRGSECVSISYPDFYSDLLSLTK